MNSPKVVVQYRFTFPLKKLKKQLDPKKISSIKKRIIKKFDYFSNEEKRVINLFDYYTGKINKAKTVNLVLENGKHATENQIKLRKTNFIKYAENSFLWQGIVSFNNDYIDRNITLEALEKEFALKVLPALFRKMGFNDKNKMAYNFSIHTDTDNYHIHFSFCEKVPNYINSKNNIIYRPRGLIKMSEINFLKNEIIYSVERNRFIKPLIKDVNEEIEILKKYFKPNDKNFTLLDKKDLILENKILELGKLLFEDRKGNDSKIKYNSLKNNEIKKLTKEVKHYIFNKDSECYSKYGQFKECLNKINNYLKKISDDNSINSYIVDKKYTMDKEKYLDNYIYNAIINYAHQRFSSGIKTKKITEKELFQEIILKQYDKRKNRFNILHNYLSNNIKQTKFKTKYEIINSIKNINDELEQAEREFSKLFNNNVDMK